MVKNTPWYVVVLAVLGVLFAVPFVALAGIRVLAVIQKIRLQRGS